jgi:RNA polymerase sigma-70 factor (ECF subfamily)
MRKSEIQSENLYDEIFFHDLEKSIDTAVDTLPSQQQRIFKLSRYDGLTYHEIAARLDLSLRTVENQMYRALKAIKTILQEKYF